MKKQKRSRLYRFIFFTALCLSLGTCDTEGDPGPPGEEGPQGPQGPPGAYEIGEGLTLDGETLRVDFGTTAGQAAEGNDPRFDSAVSDIQDLQRQINELIPIGTISLFAGTVPPEGWLLCDGTPILRADYPGLFAVIGETFGAGNGITTFNLPDLRGRAPIGAGQGAGLSDRQLGTTIGAETHTLSISELPSHTHEEHPRSGTNWFQVFNFNAGTWGNERDDGNALGQTTGATGGGQPHNIMQPSLSLHFIIKA